MREPREPRPDENGGHGEVRAVVTCAPAMAVAALPTGAWPLRRACPAWKGGSSPTLSSHLQGVARRKSPDPVPHQAEEGPASVNRGWGETGPWVLSQSRVLGSVQARSGGILAYGFPLPPGPAKDSGPGGQEGPSLCRSSACPRARPRAPALSIPCTRAAAPSRRRHRRGGKRVTGTRPSQDRGSSSPA